MKSELFLLLVSLHTFSVFSKGKAYSLPYESIGGKCINSSTEYIPSDTNLCCSKCKPGNHLSLGSPCFGKSDTSCKPCSGGTYSEALNYHTNCFSCTTCLDRKGLMYSKNCTSVSDAECQCKPGLVCNTLDSSQRCSECRPPKKCPPGKGTHREYNRCVTCAEGTFSNDTNTQHCQPHTKCEERGMDTLDRGDSKKDTKCGPGPVTIAQDPQTQTTTRVFSTSSPTTVSSPSTSSLTETSWTTPRTDKSESNENESNMFWIGPVIAVVLLGLLTAGTFVMCHRKDLPKHPITEAEPGQASEAGFHSKTEYQHLLEGKTDPSTSSSVSESNSQNTGTSQDSIHTEQPVVSSPCVVNITATFNCHVNPSPGSCSIPITPLAQPQPVQPDLPLSLEEQLRVSCEEENSKEALQSVQERGMSMFKA